MCWFVCLFVCVNKHYEEQSVIFLNSFPCPFEFSEALERVPLGIIYLQTREERFIE